MGVGREEEPKVWEGRASGCFTVLQELSIAPGCGRKINRFGQFKVKGNQIIQLHMIFDDAACTADHSLGYRLGSFGALGAYYERITLHTKNFKSGPMS